MVSTGRDQALRVLRRPLVAAAVLLAVYGLLSFANSPDGYLGTDTGAKVATLERMIDAGSWRPAVGYWAEEWDPEGRFHPLLYTNYTDADEWVNVTTLPMLLAARPLYALGGYQLTLLLPMLGAIGAALAARDLARQLGGDDAGVRAFWIVGLASPMVVYALDFWEHSIGAALMLFSASALLRVVDGRGGLGWAGLAGLALGTSATMRTETFLFALAAVGLACLSVLLVRRRPLAAVGAGVAAVIGFAVPWFANAVLETELGGIARSDRATGAANQNVFDQLADRTKEAAITWFGLPGAEYPAGVVGGMVVVVGIVGAVILFRRNEERAGRMALVGSAVVLVLLLANAGLSFVPGAFIASPLAVLAFVDIDWRRETYPLATAILATIGIWLFQFLGGAGPQWGGRYILGPTLVLTSIGAVHLRSVPPIVGRFVLVAAVGVTAFGAVWLSVRSHDVDDFFDDLADRPEDVVIATNGFLVREAGSEYVERRYLSVSEGETLDGALEVAADAGLATAGVVTDDERPSVDRRPSESERIEFLGAPLWYHRFELASEEAASPP